MEGRSSISMPPAENLLPPPYINWRPNRTFGNGEEMENEANKQERGIQLNLITDAQAIWSESVSSLMQDDDEIH